MGEMSSSLFPSVNVMNTSEANVNPATSDNQTNGTQKTKLSDASGTQIIGTNGTIAVAGYEELVAKELISGAKSIHITGRNLNVNNVRLDVWEGPTAYYVFPPAGGIQMQIVSTDVNDTLAGTGVQKIRIHYLDNAYAELHEDINMNGTTPVNTVATNILRINGIHSIQSGSNSYAVGAISLTNLAVSITYAIILATYNESRQAVYTVPAGKTFYLNHWQGSSGTASGTHFTRLGLRATSHDGTVLPNTFITMDELGTLNSGGDVNLPVAFKFPATTDIKIATKSDSASASAIVMGAFHGWIE